jgi:xanthine dehydrogenase accessory factor
MDEMLEQLGSWRAEGREVAVATVVRTSGSTPRREGAKLLVTADGQLAGSVSGGCVETDVATHAQEVLKVGRPRLVGYGISDEQGIEVGLACGGAIEVLIEPEPHAIPLAEGAGVLVEPEDTSLLGLVRQEVPVAVATVVRPEALAGRRAVLARGELNRSLGDSGLDRAFRDAAPGLLRSGLSKTITAQSGVGDDVEIFIDTYPAPPTLLIFGGVHVAIPLTRYARSLGFRVNVIDPRGVFANKERFAEADELAIEHPEDYLARTEINENSYVVVLNHDPKFDEPVLKHVMRTRASYVGAIGSRKTNQERLARLRSVGLSDEALAQIHSPIGLDIGAQSPEEIALAIIAEVVAARYGKAGRPLRDVAGAPA